MPRPILVVEDDPDLAEGLRYNLERERFPVCVAADGEQALGAALDARNPPALILLDLMLPNMGGLEICRRLRREPATRRTPIIMVTARASEADVAAGLDLGADDYIKKPFSVRELLARVRAVLRRAEAGAAEYFDEQLAVDFARMSVRCEGREVRLTRKEFALLAALVESAGRVATRKYLLETVWGHLYEGGERTLDVHIRRLRQSLGACGERIETVSGVGYRFRRSAEAGGEEAAQSGRRG
jgi:two-component system, OmpR family, alkaline phosphatase synthesis response regulator PhoP